MPFQNNYTVLEVADKIGISVSTIYSRINKGEINCEEIPYVTRFHGTIKTIHATDIPTIKLKRRGRKPRLKHFIYHVKKGGAPHGDRTL